MGDEILKRDPNWVASQGAVTDDEDKEVVAIRVNPVTKRLKTEIQALSSDTDSITVGSPENICNGQKNVTTAGERVALSTEQTVISVCIKANIANTGSIYVGNSSVSASNGYVLEAGETISFDITDLSTIYLDSSVNGEGVSYIAIG